MDELYGLIVVKCGISPKYFLDSMTPREMEATINAYYDKDKGEWERTRSLGHIIASVNSSKPLKATDVMKFPWDNKVINDKVPKTKEDIQDIINKVRNQ